MFNMTPEQIQMLMMAQGGAPQPSAVPQAPTMPGTIPPGGAAGTPPGTLASLLGSIQAPEPHRSPLPGITYPDVPRAMNPEFSQLVMQALMSASNSTPNIDSLGSLLGGK